MLNHRVEVRSTPGKGTGISIEIPQAQTRVHAAEVLSTPVDEVESLPRNVLVIEDETSVRSAVIRLLKLRGVGTVAVATANDALALVTQQGFRPALVLSDYNLRGSTDGVECIEALRSALGWNVPAIVMTGDTRSETTRAIVGHDMSVLIKPFVADELLQQIKRLSQYVKKTP